MLTVLYLQSLSAFVHKQQNQAHCEIQIQWDNRLGNSILIGNIFGTHSNFVTFVGQIGGPDLPGNIKLDGTKPCCGKGTLE